MPGVPASSRTTIPARVALLVLAALAAGWLAVGLRNQHLQDEATRLLLRPGQERPAIERLDDARLLNANSQPELLAAAGRWRLGEREEGIRDLRALLRDEPENRVGWAVLADLLQDSDPRGAAQARRRVDELNGSAVRRP
jgi:predicted Zn-dependent protease